MSIIVEKAFNMYIKAFKMYIFVIRKDSVFTAGSGERKTIKGNCGVKIEDFIDFISLFFLRGTLPPSPLTGLAL